MTPEQAAHEYALSKTQGTEIGFPTHDRLYNAFLAGHAHAQNMWVKVTAETIPDDERDVLAFICRNGNANLEYYYQIIYRDCGVWTDGDTTYYEDGDDRYIVTHFQELPQPPENG